MLIIIIIQYFAKFFVSKWYKKCVYTLAPIQIHLKLYNPSIAVVRTSTLFFLRILVFLT